MSSLAYCDAIVHTTTCGKLVDLIDPDCREPTMRALEDSIRKGMDFPEFEIVHPIMFINKAQTFKKAEDLGVLPQIIKNTHTCYNGDHHTLHDWGYGCGECPACKVREAGWLKYKAGDYSNPDDK